MKKITSNFSLALFVIVLVFLVIETVLAQGADVPPPAEEGAVADVPMEENAPPADTETVPKEDPLPQEAPTEPQGTETSAQEVSPVPTEAVGSSASEQPAPAPETPVSVSQNAPKPPIPSETETPESSISSVPVAQAETIIPDAATEEIPESQRSLIPYLLAALAAGVLGFFVWKANSAKNDDPCKEIKNRRDGKEAELENMKSRISLEETLREKLKEELNDAKVGIAEKAAKKAVNKTGSKALGKSLNVALSAKEIYDNIGEKYDKAERALSILRMKSKDLSKELSTLQSDYKKCMLGADTATNIVNAAEISIPVILSEKHVSIAIFDADGVAVKLREKYFSRRFSEDYGVPTEKIESFFRKEFPDCILGKKDLKEILVSRAIEWGWKGTMEELLEYWWRGENKLNMEVIKQAGIMRKKGIKCYLASDSEKYRADFLMFDLGLNNYFDGGFFSSDLGFTKDKKKFWQEVVKQLGSPDPKDIAYWDDEVENVRAAEKVGIRARHFIRPEDLV